jgi:hypothetical protein
MKKKLKMTMLSLIVLGASVGTVSADVETPGGPEPTYDCAAPMTNICTQFVDNNGKTVKIKGTLTVTLP